VGPGRGAGGGPGATVRAVRWLPLLMLLAACDVEGPIVDLTGRSPVDPPLPDLPLETEPPMEDGRLVFRVLNGKLVDLDGKKTIVPPGEHQVLLLNDVPGADVGVHGMDLRNEAMNLWLHGWSSHHDRLPQFSSGQVNGGVRDDWNIDLVPGIYVLEETLDGESSGILLVR
jgi:hypothetical protein